MADFLFKIPHNLCNIDFFLNQAFLFIFLSVRK